MSFVNNSDSPIEFFLMEVASLMAVRDGIKHREAHVKILETAGYWIGYYELALTAKQAFNKFKDTSV
ncbi:hypothetical protein D9M71_619090 [compost metagenome]